MNTPSTMKYSDLMLGLLLGLLGLSPLAARADDAMPATLQAANLQIQQQNGIAYLSGGVGQDESQAIKQRAGYSLHMTFCEGTGQYVVGVDVDIRSSKGQPVLSLQQVGPLLYADLPAGSYRVDASYMGMRQQRNVQLGRYGTRSLNFNWR